MRWLCHVHLGRTTYSHATIVQDSLVASFLRYKSSPLSIVPPPPTIITSEFYPVYTLGRRDRGLLTPAQQSYLSIDGKADVFETLRGGQTTFHGPGQMTAYPILDLKAYNISPKYYVQILEDSLIKTIGRYGVQGYKTEHPGVWVTSDRKIAAVGVHMRRHITSHGVSLNVHTDLSWFRRILACGLERKATTSLRAEGINDVKVDEIASTFSEILAGNLGLDGVKSISADEVLRGSGVNYRSEMQAISRFQSYR